MGLFSSWKPDPKGDYEANKKYWNEVDLLSGDAFIGSGGKRYTKLDWMKIFSKLRDSVTDYDLHRCSTIKAGILFKGLVLDPSKLDQSVAKLLQSINGDIYRIYNEGVIYFPYDRSVRDANGYLVNICIFLQNIYGGQTQGRGNSIDKLPKKMTYEYQRSLGKAGSPKLLSDLVDRYLRVVRPASRVLEYIDRTPGLLVDRTQLYQKNKAYRLKRLGWS